MFNIPSFHLVNLNIPIKLSSTTTYSYGSEWNITWDGNNDDKAEGIIINSSGDIYITGYTNISGRDYDAFIAKYDSSGNQEWIKFWDNNSDDKGYDIALDESGNIYITGYTTGLGADENAFIAKYDSNGNSLLNVSWGGDSIDRGYGIVLDNLGNIFITGETLSYGSVGRDAFIAKFNSTGNLEMNATWNNNNYDYGYDIALDNLGNIYITGYTLIDFLNYDIFIAKFNSSGDLKIDIIRGGLGYDVGHSIVIDNSGNIYITGESTQGNDNVALIAIYNNTGYSEKNLTWSALFDAYGRDIILNNSNHIYITGYMLEKGYDVFYAHYDNAGNLYEENFWGGGESDYGLGIALDNSGNIYITGYTNSFGGIGWDVFIVKNPYRIESYVQTPKIISGFNYIFLTGILGFTFILLIKKRLK